jgi:SAM-dependent methyltransferase
MTPTDLRRLAFDFRAARAVSCGVELGLFEALGSGAERAYDLAHRCEAEPRALAVLLDALVAIGVLERCKDTYRIPKALVGCLVPGEPGFVGNLLLHDLWHWTSWARLDEVVRRGSPLADRSRDPHLANPAVLRRFLPNLVRAMEQSTDGASHALALALAPLEPKQILDLGGGTGAHLIALLQELPAARGTLAEQAFSLDAARVRVAESGLGDRIEFRLLDFEHEPIPQGHDLLLLSRVLMGLPADRAEKLLCACAGAVAPGGTLAIHDYAGGSRIGALLSLDMLLHTGGAVHSAETVAGWLAQSGLEVRPARRVLPYTRLFTARKPG